MLTLLLVALAGCAAPAAERANDPEDGPGSAGDAAQGASQQEPPANQTAHAEPATEEPDTPNVVEWTHSYALDTCTPVCYGITSLGNNGFSGFAVTGDANTLTPVLIEFTWEASTPASESLRCTLLSHGKEIAEWTGTSPVANVVSLPEGEYTLRTRPAAPAPFYVVQEIQLRATGSIVPWSALEG